MSAPQLPDAPQRDDTPADSAGPASTGAAHRVAKAALTWAVRGRAERGTEWGEAMLRELAEVDGGRQALRWAASGAWTAWRDRVRRLPNSRLLAALPRPLRPVVSVLTALIIGAGSVLVVNQFALSMRYIPSGSMEPALDIGDRVLIDRLSFHVTGLDYGDMVSLVHHDDAGNSEHIKRVVGLPGDVISCTGGRLVRNGISVDEAYLPAGTTTWTLGAEGLADCPAVTVPDGDIFVLGDHREVSFDSRLWGPIRTDTVVGRVLTTVW
jgi:signal peptidase I